MDASQQEKFNPNILEQMKGYPAYFSQTEECVIDIVLF